MARLESISKQTAGFCQVGRRRSENAQHSLTTVLLWMQTSSYRGQHSSVKVGTAVQATDAATGQVDQWPRLSAKAWDVLLG